MSTSRHIDKICVAVVAVTLALTILFLCGERIGISVITTAVKYERTLFDTSYVHKIDIVMDGWDSFLETCENEEYAACTVVVDGEKHANIAIRAKGNTSLSSVKNSGTNRYSFKLEFDRYEVGKTLDGLDKLCLNNLIQDNTMMKDYIVYQLMNDFGADSPLCSFAYLTVNGEDWGLYLAVEGIEESFLSRNYGSDAGELYKPDSMSFGGGRGNGKGFNMDDFDFGGDEEQGADAQQAQNGSRNNASDEQAPASAQQQPEGSGFPDGAPPDGQFPGMPGADGEQSFPSDGQFPGMPGADGEQNFPYDGQFPGMPGANGEQNDASSGGQAPDMSGGKGGFSFGGMGSDDVKLQYIDDDPDSYPNIFDNAKTDVSAADKKRLIASLKSLSAYTELEDVLDMDEVLRYFVVHNFVCNGDSYTGSMIHNYYLHESDGKLGMIPWDYNLAFGTFMGNNASGTVNTSIDSPVSSGSDDRPMVGWIFSDETYTEQYHQLFAGFLAKWFTDGELEQLIAETADMIRPYVEKDPTKFCTTEEFEKGVAALSQFVSMRAEAVSRQLAGDTTAVETGSLDLSDMGTMGGGMGGDRAPGGAGTDFSGDFNALSMLVVTDRDGNTVDLSEVIGDLSAVTTVTLSDGTTIELASANIKDLMKTDLSKIVSVTDIGGNVTDLSEYTVEANLPSGRSDGKGDNAAQQPKNGDTDDPTGETVPGQNRSAEKENSGARPQFPSQGGAFDLKNVAPRKSSEAPFWILLGVSAAVLAAGLFAAIKKKY